MLPEGADDFELVEYKKDSIEVPDYDDTGPPEDEINIPALVVNDDFTMVEGAAICLYLADSYGRFLPDQEHKAEYYRYWILDSQSTYLFNLVNQ